MDIILDAIIEYHKDLLVIIYMAGLVIMVFYRINADNYNSIQIDTKEYFYRFFCHTLLWSIFFVKGFVKFMNYITSKKVVRKIFDFFAGFLVYCIKEIKR